MTVIITRRTAGAFWRNKTSEDTDILYLDS